MEKIIITNSGHWIDYNEWKIQQEFYKNREILLQDYILNGFPKGTEEEKYKRTIKGCFVEQIPHIVFKSLKDSRYYESSETSPSLKEPLKEILEPLTFKRWATSMDF